MKPLVISFSGGRTSAYMTILLLKKWTGLREIYVIFANTGKEREETLEFVRLCDVYFNFKTIWIESFQFHGKRKGAGGTVVNFDNASRKGEPFEDMIKKHGIPNQAFPHCSRELKTVPIKSYLKVLGIKNYEIALGIRIDEPKRLKKRRNIIYPLAADFPTTKIMVNRWWFKQSFNLELKDYEGNCDMCWKKSKRKHLTILLEHPEFADFWNESEIKYGNFIPPTQTNHRLLPITFFRDNTSTAELIEDSKGVFTIQQDAFSIDELMFFQPELDFEDSGCGKASCEPFI